MNAIPQLAVPDHEHVFLGEGHDRNAHKTWWVIALCSVVMVVEIVGGLHFGSLALIADGLHMSTHAAAMLIAAVAYTYARRHARDTRFSFGTGKVGDLAGFSSAIILAMIALLIGYEAVDRLLHPVRIGFNEAIAIAFLGLIVNIVSAWMLSGGDHGHHHGNGHAHDHSGHAHDDEPKVIDTPAGRLQLSIFEDGVPPRFRVRSLQEPGSAQPLWAADVMLTTVRTGGEEQRFALRDVGDCWESVEEIPEPHDFSLHVKLGARFESFGATLHYEEPIPHTHGGHHRDHNMRAAFVHVAADAAVSVLAILGLAAGKFFGLNFMDPVMGIVGALVIANWSFGLVRDTGAILLDMNPDRRLSHDIATLVKAQGDSIRDLHLWRLGPGHLGAILAVQNHDGERDCVHYQRLLARFSDLSHVTVQVTR
ncbi:MULTISPECIES: CDF family Co(II)/Ni(II) efflux transporter DmeF [unclassified Thiomonas]|jgi:cation diffusion facilitator family transporter|uniref:CDF family Co(II)/Ni(II) efflux transporter DmeF n=1 Tax=unclassified Thiomonas TaxID=2625466 RepID=UPI0004DBC741|nr:MULTISPECIES: CDF family Co(II)/Ni(II) efflux transporter DmeF [unclassified Thiomonas]CDW96373.1 putative Co/Zn/Cd efflux system component [Thiomonas sp. CB2]VDY06703.1 putative Co/Zn/Cd efflux system component [Thiomonas sp. Bio17B3]VDY10003.1 putative Co/Zn/Cd efflux system component [Thiomonas sp. Sup16B3]VDY14977.1 Putative Co/Zn/Cd efflux system component [Thiomonas sp. OC7]VDY15846.1 putative Co/Zn/Cd efflux system component [Thiomonas sp. CB2]